MSRIQKYESIVEAQSPEQEFNPQEHTQLPRVRHLRLVQAETETSITEPRPSLMRMLMDAGEYGVDPYGNTLPSEQRDML